MEFTEVVNAVRQQAILFMINEYNYSNVMDRQDVFFCSLLF